MPHQAQGWHSGQDSAEAYDERGPARVVQSGQRAQQNGRANQKIKLTVMFSIFSRKHRSFLSVKLIKPLLEAEYIYKTPLLKAKTVGTFTNEVAYIQTSYI